MEGLNNRCLHLIQRLSWLTPLFLPAAALIALFVGMIALYGTQ